MNLRPRLSALAPPLATTWLASAVLLSCAYPGVAGNDRLTARPPGPGAPVPVPGPGADGTGSQVPGLHTLDGEGPRATLVYVPSTYQPDRPAPLVVMLHGAGGDPPGGLDPLIRLADDNGLLLVAPASSGPTWDVIRGSYGPDVGSIDQALQRIFAEYRVDPARLAIGGFSDGASYALSVGLDNGDLFTHVIAFSPGFEASSDHHGRPRVFITHGRQDPILPLRSTSGRIVPRLRGDGYDVTYRKFDGGHTVPADLAQEAVAWLLGGSGERVAPPGQG